MGFVMNAVPELLQHERFSKIISWSQVFPLLQHFIPQQPWIPTTNKTISTLQKKQQGMVLVLTHKHVHSHEERKSHQDEDSGLLRHDAVSLGEGFPLFCWNKWPQLQGSRVPKECQTQGAQRTHWRSRHYIPSKYWKPLVQRHTIICLKTWIHEKMQWETKMSH